MRKKVYGVMLIVVITIQNITYSYALKNRNLMYSEYVNSIIPNEVKEYFDVIGDTFIKSYLSYVNREQPINNYVAGEPFIIFNTDKNISEDAWYYPIYIKNSIECILVIGFDDSEFYCNITKDYVERLNALDYTNQMIIFQTTDGIYIIDEKNNINTLYGINNVKEVEYSDIYERIRNQHYFEDVITSKKIGIKNDTSKLTKSLVDITNNGATCIMNNCLVKQYDYDICWAAAAATVIRYKTSNSSINAFDIVNLCDYPVFLDNGKPYYGGSIDDIQFSLCYYGVYYSIINRQLKWEEIKSEIKNENPVVMASYGTDIMGWVYGHATVLIGYEKILFVNAIYMWNPASGEVEAVVANDSGEFKYKFGGIDYTWTKSVCNSFYTFK